VFAHDAKLALARLKEFVDAGLSVGELLDQLIDHWRDLMLVACAGKDAPNLNTPGRFRAALEQQAAAGNLDTVLAGLDILVSAKNRLRSSGQAQTLVQMALIRLCRLDDLTPLSQLAMWLSQPGSAAVGPGQTLKSGVAASVPATLPPEGKKKPVEAESANPGGLTAESLPVVWPEVIAQLGLTTGGSLQKAGLPAIFGPNALVLSFPPEYNAAYEHCSGSASVQRLEGVLKQVTGQTWSVRMEKRPGPAGGANGTANGAPPAPPPRVRQQETMQQHPILRRAMEVFDALPVFLDAGFGSEPPAKPATPATEPNADDEA
jgi:DNA polymerase-3 subunit gamma/tau